MINKKRMCYFVVFLILIGMSIAACFVKKAPRSVDPENESVIVGADVAWMLSATGLVLLMTPGVAFFYGGMVGSRNVIATMLQSLVAMGLISVFWIIIGFSLSFGEDAGHFIGNPATYWMFRRVGANPDADLSPTIPLALYALFQMKFAIITPALITGSFAERIRFPGYFTYILLWHMAVYCPLAHWTWHPGGFLRRWGVLDFAGGTVVHMSSGYAALAGAIVLGRRKSHKDRQKHVAANIPFVILGTSLLWFGWFGFNAGSALAANATAVTAFLATNTAAAMSMITWLCMDGAQGRKPSATGACVGAVVGLVAITPACGYVSVQSSIFIGLIGAIMSNLACSIKSSTTLDDTLDVFPCHGVGGMTGLICTGFFANDVGVVSYEGRTFGYHWLALLIVSGYAFTVSYLLYVILNLIIPLRVDPWKEEQGLDMSQHGETLYAYEAMDCSVCSSNYGVRTRHVAATTLGGGDGNGRNGFTPQGPAGGVDFGGLPTDSTEEAMKRRSSLMPFVGAPTNLTEPVNTSAVTATTGTQDLSSGNNSNLSPHIVPVENFAGMSPIQPLDTPVSTPNAPVVLA